ncbi:hypothetical protein POM88_022303 [Heracleum sosnowskyi]|uniref:Uncharacterized protein n=1 Tax=Heracleum sosnowskyi TaxID=360622 RepID=A0AAD8IHH6_9APIA|nr:hypothetical protein POM88_022303 [Heracleum sosnowskyi]
MYASFPLSQIRRSSEIQAYHETSFVRDHTSFWTKSPILFYLVCFLRQFFRSVTRADYLTMRHGFISVHLAPGTKFDFQKYIKRSLEDDFKVVVGISPVLWTSTVIYLTLNVEGYQAMFWLSVLPLVVILLVGTKLQAIISQMDIKKKTKYLVTFTVGFDQRNNIDATVKKFSEDFQILFFHYDGRTSEWDQFEWSKRSLELGAWSVELVPFVHLYTQSIFGLRSPLLNFIVSM